ncbi:MAG: flagellar hook-associated protein FlgK [Oscillospiraceae bacterium]|jgi:flagellar hook-associated protein 1 FlgK|nr:flagellar hook-associated protein FlgK [Oscillospiraceae bacterium]
MIMRSSFFAFETARRAIANAQLGLDTVGHNTSNIDTPGYTRQRVDQVSWAVNGNSKYAVHKGFYPGMGAVATGISQIRDPFLDARYRAEAGNYGEYIVRQDGMNDLQNIFDEVMSDALHEGLGNIVDKLEKALSQPDAQEYASTVRKDVEKFTSMLNKYSTELGRMRDNQMDDLEVSVNDEVNRILKEIAHLNEQINKVEVYGNPGNELRDERNMLLDELAGFVDIQVTETKKEITQDVALNYLTVTIKGTNIELVNKDQYAEFNFNRNGDLAELSFTDAGGTAHNAAATDALLEKGGLRGYLDIINGSGSYTPGAGENDYKGIVYAQKYLDSLAQSFADAINAVNKQNNGGTDKPLITNSTNNSMAGVTASTIAISSEWRADPNEIILSNSDTIANPVEAMRFINAISTEKRSGVLPDLPNTTFQELVAGFTGLIGSEKKQADELLAASTKVISTLDDQRQSISGVSENEEAINMMTYSNYYNAAVRYMTTLDEALDKIINGMGIVGR